MKINILLNYMDIETYTTIEISNIKDTIYSNPQCIIESYDMISTYSDREILITFTSLSITILCHYYDYNIIYKNIAITVDTEQHQLTFAYIKTDMNYLDLEFLKNYFVNFISEMN
jgi:hypothetical protein